MGYALLWIENLLVSLLLVATVLACVGRLRRGWLRLALGLPVPLLLLLCYAALTVATAALQFRGWTDRWFGAAATLAGLFLVGTAWLVVRGLRRCEPQGTSSAAASWPRGKLAVALGAAAVLHAMTFWNMDLVARQQLAALRVEAGAVALSVVPPRAADRDNAALVYQQAFEAMGRHGPDNPLDPGTWQWDEAWTNAWDGKWTQWHDAGQIGFDLHDPQLRRFLARQAPALRLLRQAAAMPGCYFEHDYGRPDIAMLLPELACMRTAAHLLALDAVCSAADGNYRQAVEDVNTMFLMAEHTASDPILVSELVAMAVDRLAIDALQAVLATHDRAPADDLSALRVSDALSYRAMLKRGLRYEEAFRLATFEQVGTGVYGPGQLADNDGLGPCAILASAPVYRIFLLGDDLAAQKRFSFDLDRAARQPYWKVKDIIQGYDGQLRSAPGGMLTAFLMPALGRVVEVVTEAEARRSAARLGLALYTYRARNGRVPEKLDDLVPEFIPAVPLDPFDGKPMRLKRTGRGVTVYSVGPDMTDNDGAPLDKQTKTGDIVFTLAEGSDAEQ